MMLRRLQASKTVCVYRILRFCASPQIFQTLVPAKNSHLNEQKWHEPLQKHRICHLTPRMPHSTGDNDL